MLPWVSADTGSQKAQLNSAERLRSTLFLMKVVVDYKSKGMPLSMSLLCRARSIDLFLQPFELTAASERRPEGECGVNALSSISPEFRIGHLKTTEIHFTEFKLLN